jgi:predicted permease
MLQFHARVVRSVHDLPRDVRFAARLLIKDRWFTAAAVFALSLGIAANSTVYTVINTMMLRGLPVAHPDRFVAFLEETRAPLAVSYRDVEDWRAATASFAGLAAYAQAAMTVDDQAHAPEQFGGAYIAGHAFQLLDEQPLLGRALQPRDDRRGAPTVVVLGYRVWKSRYDSDAAIVGRAVRVNGVPSIVVGVMREGFRFPLLEDIWQPLATMPGLATEKRDARTLRVFGRLADGVSIGSARAEIAAVGMRLAREHSDTNPAARILIDPFTGTPRHPVYLALFGAVALVLLIACANVANLLLARSTRRSREISIRISLGASRWRIVRQLLVESVMLAAIAGALGLLLSVVGVRVYAYAVSDINFPYWYDHRWTMDRRVFTFVAAICLASAVISGLVPALQLSKPDVNDALKDGGRGRIGTSGARRWTGALLVGQLAFTLILLTGAALLMRSFLAVYRADAIVDASPIMTYSLRPPAAKYRTPAERVAFFEHLLARLDADTPVQAASITNAWPFGYTPQWRAAIDDGSPSDERVAFTASYVTAGPRYFETLGLTVVRGRDFDELDGLPGHDAAIVNQLLATRWFGGADPIGRRIAFVDPAARGAKPFIATIVGVSPTVRQTVLEDLSPVIYAPLRANPPTVGRLLVDGRDGRRR